MTEKPLIIKFDMADVWSNSFFNSKKFWQSKGNVQTRSKLKEQWYQQMVDDCKQICEEALKQNGSQT
jgi:hypothetical protein